MAIRINGTTVISDSQAITSTSTISAAGNITGGNVSVVGTITAAGVNTGSSPISTTGNITGGNILTSGLFSINGNIVSTGNINIGAGESVRIGTLIMTDDSISSSDHVITIGSAGNIGNVVIVGNLQVNGTTTTINSNTLTTNDLVISVANNAVNGAAANNGGFEVGPIGAPFITWLYNNAANIWVSSGGISAVGTITSSNVSATNVSATNHTGTTVSVTGNITGGNLSVGNGTITGGNIVSGSGNGVGNIGSSTIYFNTVFAKATSAQYADLAEKYTADAEYAPGTVVVFGGSAEVTVNAVEGDTKVAGVVSTNPSYIMNGTLEAEHVATVALTGRVPTMVHGPVRKGDLMVAAGLGRAQSAVDPKVGSVIGKSLEDFDGEEGTIEVVVGRF
jgi:hypothetical protein